MVAPALFPLALAGGCGDSGGSSSTSSTSITVPMTSSGQEPGTSTGGEGTPTTSTSGGSHEGTHGETGSTSTSTSDATSSTGSDTLKLDVGANESGESGMVDCDPPAADATIEGIVVAPNLVIPVSGALVYATAEPPEGIPDNVYCEECVELPCDTPYVLTNPDGSFSLPTTSGMKYVVVQKGQFLRATPIDVAPGINALGVDSTSLPDHRDDASHLYIPNIALALGDYDRLEDALAKLGLADTLVDNNSYTESFVEGTQQFDLWSNTFAPEYATLGGIDTLVNDYSKLEKYHILFVPCSADDFIDAIYTQQAKDNMRKWVDAGGRFYVADWSNEYLFAAFGQYQQFYKDKDFGGTDLLSPYDSLGMVMDPDLLAWLEALPAALKDINPMNGNFGDHPAIDALPQLLTVDNWSGVESTPPVLVDDGMGGQVDVGHKTWIAGPGDGYNVPFEPKPLTITGQYGCGKLMFTTYHMAEFQDSYIGLTPQELVLLYLILEIGVCQEKFEPPPPPE